MTKLPVIDGEEGGDTYGTASSRGGALAVANRFYADRALDAYLSPGPITLRDGTTIGDAWVATTFKLA